MGSAVVEGLFPLKLVYNTARGSDLRITFHGMKLKSVDGAEVWNTTLRKRKSKASEENTPQETNEPLAPAPKQARIFFDLSDMKQLGLFGKY